MYKCTHTDIYIYQFAMNIISYFRLYGGISNVMVTFIGNGRHHPISKPG